MSPILVHFCLLNASIQKVCSRKIPIHWHDEWLGKAGLVVKSSLHWLVTAVVYLVIMYNPYSLLTLSSVFDSRVSLTLDRANLT